jgi:aminoglycoside phosphotransferase
MDLAGRTTSTAGRTSPRSQVSGRHPSLCDEAARLRWCVAYLPVPPVVEPGRFGRSNGRRQPGCPGLDATRHPLRAEPGRLVPALAAGLRRLHQVPAAACPFDFTLDKV